MSRIDERFTAAMGVLFVEPTLVATAAASSLRLDGFARVDSTVKQHLLQKSPVSV